MDSLLGIADLPANLALDQGMLVAMLLFVATASLVAFCVPGVIIPMAVTSSALVGMWPSVAIVGLGALVGSQILFIAMRYLARDRMHLWLGGRLESFEIRFASYGIWYVIGLRLIGAPHFLVTAASAFLPIGSLAFAGSTVLGLLPALSLAAAAGSAF